jgi:hypothetical protein
VSRDVIANGDDDGSTLAANSGLDELPKEIPLRRGRELLSHEMFRDLAIVPSQSASTSAFQVLNPGMKAMKELLLAGKDSLEEFIPQSDDLQDWLSQCQEAYFQSFHLRWPVLNCPSFDAGTAALPLAAAVCVIGVWLGNQPDPEERQYALQVHDLLLHGLLLRMVRSPVVMLEERWEC